MNGIADIELDLSGLLCPLPLLKTKQALNKMSQGEKVRVLATDPGSERDFKVFADQSGNLLLEAIKIDEKFCYLIEKK